VSSNDQVSVVVTGLGATTPLGGDVASTWSAMLAGTSGVRRLTDSWVDSLPVKIAATAAVDPVAIVGGASSSRWSRPGRRGPTPVRRRLSRTGSASR
jgi:3-oxoacyl-[acyl-carrier-protein] synthase II